MLCEICKDSIEGIWDPNRTPRIAQVEDWRQSQSAECFPKWSKDGDRLPSLYGHHKDEESFDASTLRGCVICNTIDPRMGPLPGEEFRQLGYFSAFAVSFKGDGDDKVPVIHFQSPRSWHSIKLARVGGIGDENIQYSLPPRTDDPKTWKVIENWAGACFQDHSLCGGGELRAYRPTRLLQILPGRNYRLVSDTACPRLMSYAALSHCWGKTSPEKPLMLRKSNYQWFSEKQTVSELPATFRDAVTVCERFEIEYLWIDRLCIIQDSVEDWNQESSTMKDVYQNAFLTVAALGAADSDGGLFVDRAASLNQILPTVLRLQLTKDAKELEFRIEKQFWNMARKEFLKEPLTQRAWVLQERVLATRTIYFGTRQVFWECCEASAFELRPQGRADKLILFDDGTRTERPWNRRNKAVKEHQATSRPLLRKNLIGRNIVNVHDSTHQLFRDWVQIVVEYCPLNLTVSSDKLVAISGLAKEAKERLSDMGIIKARYLYGLWEEDLISTLCWVVRGNNQRAEEYRAPSWSWACLDGGVWFAAFARDPENLSLADIRKVSLSYGGTNVRHGSIGDAELVIDAPWAHIDLDFDMNGVPRISRILNASKLVFQRPNIPSTAEFGAHFDTEEDISEFATFVAISAAPSVTSGWWRGEGLMLAETDRGRFRRIGVARIDYPSRAGLLEVIEALERKTVIII